MQINSNGLEIIAAEESKARPGSGERPGRRPRPPEDARNDDRRAARCINMRAWRAACQCAAADAQHSAAFEPSQFDRPYLLLYNALTRRSQVYVYIWWLRVEPTARIAPTVVSHGGARWVSHVTRAGGRPRAVLRFLAARAAQRHGAARHRRTVSSILMTAPTVIIFWNFCR